MAGPHEHQGPFVQNDRGPGLLRRLLGGGSTDPASPHQHEEPSTSSMHREPTQPTRRAGTGGASGRGIGTRIVLWILRTFGLRLAIAAGALVLVLVGTVMQDGDSSMTEFEQSSRDLQEMQDQLRDLDSSREADPAPAATPTERGTFRVTVEDVNLDRATLVAANGTRYTWIVEEPGVYGSLALNRDEEVLVKWELRGGVVHVVGVQGPNSSTP